MQTIPVEHYEAAYRVGKEVYAGKLGPSDGIKRLTEIGLNDASATFYVYNLRNMLEGELYQRAMSVEATRAFLKWIHRDFGTDGLKNALRALERHIPYFRRSSPSPMKGHVQLLAEFGAILTKRQPAEPVAWIFQGNNGYFRVDDYVRDCDEIWWAINQEYFAPQIKIGQDAFIWRAKGSGEKPAGIIAVCRVTHEPVVAKEERKALKYYEVQPPTKPYLQVGLKVERRLNEQMLRRDTIAKDDVLGQLRIIRMAAGTTYGLTHAQHGRIVALLGGSLLGRARYQDFGEAPNDDPTELRTFAAKVRRGQYRFRANLMKLYHGRCAITACPVDAVLEACHIWEHTSSGINQSENGLLLRSDIHCLFDAGLISIEPDSLAVCVSTTLMGTEYWSYHGKTLRERTDGGTPSAEFLSKRSRLTPQTA
jgi:hypothetical protein